MENLVSFALPALLCLITFRLLYTPAKWLLRLCIQGTCGLVCLWLLNTTSGFTGLTLPINAATVLLSGALGIPGTALVVLLEVI